ncbi:MAG: autotransporter outer membrane beta-barrel domain-containing protein [Pseudomonadales bacterium]|nr:autotransporter outer membrane beta-barrel domain-containing protein [Pseudomonadales bacterium]
MLTLRQWLTATVVMLSCISGAQALVVNDYTATTFTTSSNNIRVLNILEISAAVEYDTSNGESADQAEVYVSCISADENCSPGEVDISINDVGTVSVDNNQQIVFTPIDPSFEGTFSFRYEVAIPNSEASEIGTLTLVIRGSSINGSNIETVENAITDFCNNNQLSSSVQAACQEFNELTGEERINALSTISPEEVVAEFTTTVNMTKDQTGNLSNRLNALRGGATGVSIAGLNYFQGDQVLYGSWLHEMANQIGGNASADESFSPLGIFINGSITSGDKDNTDLEQGYDLDADSITIGVDYRFNDNLVAGIAYGISSSEIEFSDSDNKMDNEIDNLLFYGSWYKEAFYIDAMIGYASGDIETDRDIVLGSNTYTAEGETESSQLFFSVTGNYDFYKDAWTYGPYASLDYIDGEIEGYEEIGNSGFEVGFNDQDIESQVLTFGGRVQYAWSQPWGIIIPHGRVEWKNELSDDRDAIIGRFVLDTSDDAEFSIEADDLDSSWFQVAVGISATFQRGLSAYIDYESVVSYDDTNIDTFSFGGRWETKF